MCFKETRTLLYLNFSRECLLTGCYGHGNKFPASVTGEEFFDQMGDYDQKRNFIP